MKETADRRAVSEADDDRERARARIGTIVGGYRVDTLIGVGGMGVVFAASSIRDAGVRVALKLARGRIVRSRDASERFVAELELAQRVRHPAAVPIYAAGRTEDGTPFLVMELLEGESLASRWKRVGPFSLRKALMIGERLLDFVAACHDARVIHSDLQPGNVFLTHNGDVRVIDFGIAVVRGAGDSGQWRIAGTPGFMSPEQARGHSDDVDDRADLFAVGAILWSLVSGHALRTGRGALELAARDPARSLALVAPEVPRSIAVLVDRALATDPERRWSSAREMKAAVSHALNALEKEDTAPSHASPSEWSMRALRSPIATIPARGWRTRGE